MKTAAVDIVLLLVLAVLPLVGPTAAPPESSPVAFDEVASNATTGNTERDHLHVLVTSDPVRYVIVGRAFSSVESALHELRRVGPGRPVLVRVGSDQQISYADVFAFVRGAVHSGFEVSLADESTPTGGTP